MTNAEKYLKDGVDVEQFKTQLRRYLSSKGFNDMSTGDYCFEIGCFLKVEVKPILSEDEKVILRNLGKWIIKIGRYDNEICLIDGEDVHEELWYLQDGLFQFIQERRRI